MLDLGGGWCLGLKRGKSRREREKEEREKKRNNEKGERNFGELKSMRESVLKNYICYTIKLQYHHIFTMVL